MNCELVEGMHGRMQLDVALGSMHHALPWPCSHADAISEAGHLLRPIPAVRFMSLPAASATYHLNPHCTTQHIVTATTLMSGKSFGCLHCGMHQMFTSCSIVVFIDTAKNVCPTAAAQHPPHWDYLRLTIPIVSTPLECIAPMAVTAWGVLPPNTQEVTVKG